MRHEYGEHEEWSARTLAVALGRKWLILVAAIAIGGVLGAGIAIIKPKYVAAGFYYTPGWSLADFKRFRSEFGSFDVLAEFLLGSTPRDGAGVTALRAQASNSRFWEDAIRPLFPMTRRDAKEVFESTKERESALVMGLDLAVKATDATAARQAVIILGDYVTQTLLLSSLQTWIANGQSSTNGELLTTENRVLQTRYSIEQSQKRIAELRTLQTRYPESQRMESRQVVSADAASARYLAPIAQVVALEAGVAEANETLRRLERRARQLKVEADFFGAAVSEAKARRQGWNLLEALLETKQQIFRPYDADDDAMKELSNRFSLELKSLKDRFSIGFGFRSPILEPTQSARSPLKFSFTGAVAGLAIGLAMALFPLLFGGRKGLPAVTSWGSLEPNQTAAQRA